ncbi:DUF2599 domain-containing protein [Cellulomonas phragmiteti]|uniref:DUF2599 domain-containing protein n=1 Tax=Cellulomonas phragmiteti TaxID=478780 RepID=A0ABQ4DLS7_9CELL|nr:DUF2599 domain-containing protein [Cellulomonas phragmiteti]GIG40298.1 hypothetical protein Cph01nite_20600 [Cellulomonas phragmiteti]
MVAGAVLLAAACGVPGDVTTDRTSPAGPTTPPAAVAPAPAAEPGSGVVRDSGGPLADSARGVDAGALLPAPGAAWSRTDGADGAATLTVTGAAGTLAWVAPPRGGRPEAQADGSLTLHDEAGTVVAALAAPAGDDGSRGAWRPEGDVVALESATGSVSFVVGTAALESVTWGEAEGGRSLMVVPAGWVRGGSLAAQEALASQLRAAEPEAASGSMQAQLWCHVLGAPDKASWNLEPWRPEVSTTTLLTTRCNPTDADV